VGRRGEGGVGKGDGLGGGRKDKRRSTAKKTRDERVRGGGKKT